jgi:hypothetical protein
LFDSSLGITGIEVDATTAFEDQVSLKPEVGGIESCEFHAVVRGEAQDKNGIDAVLPKIGAQSCVFDATVIKKSAIAVDLPIKTFPEDSCPSLSA